MTTIAITPAQRSPLAWVLEVMREHASSEDCDYSVADVPVIMGEDAPELLNFPTNSVEVVTDLLWRLDHDVPDGDKLAATDLSRAICRAHGPPIVCPPGRRAPTTAQLALQGAHPDLVRRGVFKGVDFAPLAARLWKLDAMRAEGPLPRIRWRAPSRGSWAAGRAYVGRGRIIVRFTPGATVEQAAEVLMHELVHMACPRGENHGEVFRRRLIACAREAFGLTLDTAALLALGPGKHGKRAYAIDDAVVEAMVVAGVGERLRQVAPFESLQPETEEQAADRRAAKRAAQVAARETHARAKLAAWEKKLTAAKVRVGKWRNAVRYYERRQQAAAKRGGA